MALRSAEEYKKGLRDDRVVYLKGKKVEDVVEDPYIKSGVETAAFDFLLGHDPKFKDIAVMKDPESGEDISAYFEVPDSPEVLKRRFNLIKTACEYTDGAIPFVKDVGTDIINAITVAARLMGNKEYEKRINDYRRYCAINDLSMAGAVTDVKGDRSKSPGEQNSPDYYLRVVDETKNDITVSGAKAHITAGPYVDEIIVMPTRNMNDDEADYAVSFAIPVNTPGIKQVCRPNFKYDDENRFPGEKPRRGHLESLFIFDNVKIPKERVFMLREPKFAQYLAYAFTAFHRFTAVTYKIPIIETMTGLGMLAAEANGVIKASHIRELFISMIKYVETTKALALAALNDCENFDGSGLYVPNRLTSNMAKLHFASNFHEFTKGVQDIAGGILATQPTYQDWSNDEIRPYLERYLGGAGEYTAEKRLKLMNVLRHVAASDFSGWHEVCTIHAEGSFATQKMMLLMEAPIDSYKNKARELLGFAE